MCLMSWACLGSNTAHQQICAGCGAVPAYIGGEKSQWGNRVELSTTVLRGGTHAIFPSGKFVGSFVSETHVTFRFCKEQANNHTEHEGNQRINTQNRSYHSHVCLLPTQGKYKVRTLVEFFFFWVLYYYPQTGKIEECNRMCIAAQLGAPTSGTAVFNRCLLSGTAGSFLSERFPWAMYFQPPKPMLSSSVCSYSDQLPTLQRSFSFLLWLEHTQRGEDTHTKWTKCQDNIFRSGNVLGQHLLLWQSAWDGQL